MQVRLRFEGIDKAAQADIERHVTVWLDKHLLPRLSKNADVPAVLHGTLSQTKKKDKSFVARLHLPLPGKRIVAARGEGATLESAIDAALGRLQREVERHIARLRKQDAYRRQSRRARLRKLKAAAQSRPQEERTSAAEAITRLVPRLERIARHELAYLRAAGDLPANYPTLRDVVDEAVAAIERDWHAGLGEEALFDALLCALYEALDCEVAASRQFGAMLSLEAPAPPDAIDQAEEMVGEEFYEFYQPDAELLLADTIIAESPEAAAGLEGTARPEAVVPREVADSAEPRKGETMEDEQRYLINLIGDLPISWRRALLLHEREGLSVARVAAVLGLSEEAAQAEITHARLFVRQKLTQAGITTDIEELGARLRSSLP